MSGVKKNLAPDTESHIVSAYDPDLGRFYRLKLYLVNTMNQIRYTVF